MRLVSGCLIALVAFGLSLSTLGCSSIDQRTRGLRLGMSQDQVVETAGDRYVVRAAKSYAGEEWSEIWEYPPKTFTFYPRTFWVYFENGQVVQWGEPGDFADKASAVSEYIDQRRAR